ncbi:MAG: PRC and DUF2382 domain-containing protein [Actinomycetota bacterium]|nr:PRC and DUF2382 domain-containing protein [Actinomycetota bacterium]
MITETMSADQLPGKTVNGLDGKIGTVTDVYVDERTGQPAWVTVKTGLMGSSSSFVPLTEARDAGGDIVVPYDKAQVKGAPNMEEDGHLSPEEEVALYDYYEGGIAAGTSGPAATGDDAMTRSEEQVEIGKVQRESARARLRKYVVTENVTTTVPVQHEEVRLEREPITDANVGDATSGAPISEAEHEVVLHAEEPVVEKRVVPKERVRLDKEVVLDEQPVSEDVRREEIRLDEEPASRR